MYNTIVYRFLQGGDKHETIREAVKGFADYEKVFSMTKGELKPSGYVVSSLQCALWCFINSDNAEDAICRAVNLYGDPDTIGAITGGLAGVYYGYGCIPKRWRHKILVKDKLAVIAKAIAAAGQ